MAAAVVIPFSGDAPGSLMLGVSVQTKLIDIHSIRKHCLVVKTVVWGIAFHHDLALHQDQVRLELIEQ